MQLRMLFGLFFVSFLFGCTENIRAKSFGGEMKISLYPGKKLVTAIWKDADLWYLTRTMRDGEMPENYDFIESSSFGVAQGVVHFYEHEKGK